MMGPRPATMTPDELRWVRSIQWENEHTKLISAAIGDPRACVGWDATATLTGGIDSPRVGCWLFARVCAVRISEPGHGLNAGELVQAPVVWWPWRDEETLHPLPIHDPRVMTMWNAGDTHKHVGNEREAQRERIQTAKEKARERRRVELGLKARDGFGIFKRWYDTKFGFIGRERGGGERKHFYDGCLEGDKGFVGRGTPTGIIIARA